MFKATCVTEKEPKVIKCLEESFSYTKIFNEMFIKYAASRLTSVNPR